MSSHPNNQQDPGPYQLDAPTQQGQYPPRPTSSSGYPGQQAYSQHQQHPPQGQYDQYRY